jgi:hypothetical protein
MLGIAMNRKRGTGTITLNQRGYAERILEHFNMKDCNPVLTPFEPNMKLRRANRDPTIAEQGEMNTIPY